MPTRQRAARSTDHMYSKELDVATKAIKDASKEYIFKKSEVKIKDNEAGA